MRIEDIFAPGGPIARQVGAAYECRSGQVEMSAAVNAAVLASECLVVEAPTGCHAKGTPILMADGTIKRVEDVVVGDLLMAPDYDDKPRRVLSLARGRQEMVDVVPVKGDRWRVNLDHILTLVHTTTGKLVDVSVREFRGWSKTQTHLHKLIRSGVLRFAGEVAYDDLPIDPYFLGVLLGDGGLAGNSSPVVANPDPEIRDLMHAEAKRYGLKVAESMGNCLHMALTNELGPRTGRTQNPLIRKLRALGLLPVACDAKFIPPAYLTAEWSARAAMLAGLLDTDGHKTNGCYDFISKSRGLSEGVAFLARSLGLAAYVSPVMKYCQTGAGGEYWRVSISGDCDRIPCRVARKIAARRRQVKDVRRTGFAIEETGRVERYYGFSLDGDGRFLLGDFTVTHNTGKSQAYLVPAILAAGRAPKKRTIVVTANIALQEQLISKDLPALEAALGIPVKYAIAKGIGNYLCRAGWETVEADLLMGGDWDRDAEAGEMLRAWSQTTTDGDLSTLDVELPTRLKMAVTSTSEDCPGKKCEHFETCFGMAARKLAAQADIVVTNYHLFFIDLMLKRAEAGGVLPAYDVVVLDELHAAADIGRSFFGWSLSMFGVRKAVKYLLPREQNQVLRQAERFFQSLTVDRKRPRISRPGEVAADEFAAAMRAAASELFRVMSCEDNPAIADKMRRSADVLGEYADRAEEAQSLATDASVYFVETPPPDSKSFPSLTMKPRSIADTLRRLLWDDADLAVIGTSATITTGNGSFSFITGEIGCEVASTLRVPSPFDHHGRAAIVVPRKLAPPTHADFLDDVGEVVVEAVRAARGRTLCLFTSWNGLRSAEQALRRARLPYPILVQGERPRTQLIREFRDVTESVLLGVSSMWAGVDIPGESLSCVVIDKLPFDRPDDPIVEAIQQSDPRGWWSGYMLPRSIIEFRQGFGRLIRRATDRGVVVCCDVRLVEKGYGRQYLKALPPGVELHRSIADVAKILA